MKGSPTWDVVVVGAGAGGAAAAWALTQRRMSVLLLDAGPRFDPVVDYPQTSPDWDRHGFPEKPGSQIRVGFTPGQPLPDDEPLLKSWSRGGGQINQGNRRWMDSYQHVCGIGGTTLHFSGESHRLNPASMRMASGFGVAADWPIDYAELEPYYSQAENLLGVAGPTSQGVRWRSTPFPLPPHPLSWAAKTIGRGAAKLGLGWQPNSSCVLSQPWNGRPPCNYCGACSRGCPRGDKGSVDVTFIAAAVASGRCTVRPDSPVVGIEKGAGERIAAVLVGRPENGLERISAPHFVLAAGAIETPRILLASDVANESGQVGRNFMPTIATLVGALHPEPQHARRGFANDAICWDYNAPDSIPGTIGGCRIYHASAEAGLVGPANFAVRAVPGWGRVHAGKMRQLYGHALHVGGIGESLPNPRSYVDLDPSRTDRFGLPIARISSWLTAADVARLRFMAAKSRDLLIACGADDIFEAYSSWDRFTATHVFGTCRMGTNAAASVVNSDCRSHRWRNLWITDASVFPSSGGGEAPTLTIQALALRTAHRMA